MNKSKIMIADDDEDIRTITMDLLRNQGFVPVAVVNGEEVLAQISVEKPDLLLLDLSMPKLDGWAVAKKLRQDPKMKKLPIIAFTAHALSGDREKALKAGCDEYVSKPFNMTELIQKIRDAIQRSAPR